MVLDKSINILLVDDSLDARQAVRSMLVGAGFTNIEQTSNGLEAQHLLVRHKFGAVIADWTIPGVSGIELLRWMRNDARFSALPFLLLTSESSHDLLNEAITSGVDGVLIKPFTANALLNKFVGMLAR